MNKTTIAYSNGNGMTTSVSISDTSNLVIRPWVSEQLLGGIILRIYSNKIYQYIGDFPFVTKSIPDEFVKDKWKIVMDSSVINNTIYIDGFKADYYPIYGVKEVMVKGDLALNRAISKTAFAPVSRYLLGDPTKGTSWEIVSGIINTGEEEN
ncbi:hypothetical protein CXF68_09270 [Tenacibaculum sp. Bg11-29]|uniref:hypothetical protein n=1 Tax=Tenacibaculum sp. Bg11-29 TaxID=2058306 RepID=UPI000C321447|nr:hypothetical protein [Tenacibaculum sp. Bg11-29]PKH50864.1 hypothetical protein CXF68_09270 [Tenacibaculum sp. Bg11-29]